MCPRIGSARYSAGEELANAITHALGLLLALVGVWLLLTTAVQAGSIWHIVSSSLFGLTLVFLYTSSTCYHFITSIRAKQLFRTLDHVGILLLIAGTYTPFTLIVLHGSWGWSLFGVVWFLAATGIVLELSHLRYRRALSLALYVAMGWALVVAGKPLVLLLPQGGQLLLLLGGLAYTGGISFYLWHRLPYHHAIWHLFVLAGSALHFFAVLVYVLPLKVGG
jgi:hemolysin III